jgi:hypothetical protein
VLAVALALRAWGVAFGLPHVYHPDEGFEVYRALRLGMGGFDLERTGKGGLYFLLFVEYGVHFVVLRLTGAIAGVSDFARRFAEDPSAFWLMGRWTNVTLGTLTVAVVGWHGARIRGPRTGLLAALFLAGSMQHVVDSHFITVDVPMTLFAFLAIVLVVEDVAGRSRLHGGAFAASAAFAVLNKIPSALLFVPYFLGALFRGGWRGPRGLLRPATIGPALLAGLLFAAANPGIWLDWEGTRDMLAAAVEGKEDGSGPLPGPGTNLWAFYGATLAQSQGVAGLALACVGILVGAVRRCRATALHLAFLVPFLGLIAGSGSSHLYYERYVLPLLPGVALLAALGLDALVERLGRPSRAGAVAAAAGVLVVLAPVASAIRFDRRLCRTDTRTAALDWFRANVPAGERVLIEGSMEDLAQLTVPLPPTQENVAAMIERLRARDPGKAAFWEIKGPTLKEPRWDLLAVDHLAEWGTLGRYREAGVEWVVLPSDRFRGAGDPRYADVVLESRRRFRDEMKAAPDWRHAASFSTDDGSPGWNLEVWRREGSAAAPPGS